MTDPLKTWKDEVMRLAEAMAERRSEMTASGFVHGEIPLHESRAADEAEAVLRTHLDTLPSPPAQAPEGWKLVPVVATDEMWAAAAWVDDKQDRWEAMLFATPPAPGAQEPTEAELVCGDAYQVVGCLLDALGLFDHPQATKILDNLSEARMVHTDVLPWDSVEALKPAAPPSADSKDAERYRWLRAQHWSESALCVVSLPKQTAAILGCDCPSGDRLDAAIDAAMSPPSPKEPQA